MEVSEVHLESVFHLPSLTLWADTTVLISEKVKC